MMQDQILQDQTLAAIAEKATKSSQPLSALYRVRSSFFCSKLKEKGERTQECAPPFQNYNSHLFLAEIYAQQLH